MAFEQAVLLFQYGLSIIRQWKLKPPVSEEFKGHLTERWIRRLFGLFDNDETFRALLLHVPTLRLKPDEYANPKVVLQKTTWNALTALWGIREPYGRFMVRVAQSAGNRRTARWVGPSISGRSGDAQGLGYRALQGSSSLSRRHARSEVMSLVATKREST